MRGRGLLLAVSLVMLTASVARGQSTPAGTDPQSPPTQSPQGEMRPLNPTQEIAKETPEGPAIVAGPTEIRIGGYLGLTGIYRSTNSGGGTGTSFGSIPYDDTLQGNISEARLSAQSSRLSIRINAAPAPHRSTLAGYFEMDFNGSTPGNVEVTTTGVGFRLRHVFGEGQFQSKYMLAAGQAFSLMTPSKNQLSIWPSDYELSQAVDVNYVAGLVWGRRPQVRFTYRPSTSFNLAISAENPEQQLGSGVSLPSCCESELGAQYNTGDNELRVPNFMPDIVSRVAFNSAAAFHVDAGGVVRVFRHTLKPYEDTFKTVGGGLSVNSRVSVHPGSKLVGQVSDGAGMGRYIGGLVPDVTISADGEIHLIHTTSWVAGLEQAVAPSVSLAAYYSGVYTHNSFSTDADGTYIGYGYPGSPTSNNRTIQEATAVLAWQAWKIAGRGSMQWSTQLSWLRRSPWSQEAGPADARSLLFFTQIRYNLP